MQDRIAASGRQGYVSLSPIDGETNVYQLTMADNATQQGTNFSKATMLKDATAGKFGLGTTALPDQIFSILGDAVLHNGNTLYDALNNKLGEMLYVESGSYVGTGHGTPGGGALVYTVPPLELNFDCAPLILYVFDATEISASPGQGGIHDHDNPSITLNILANIASLAVVYFNPPPSSDEPDVEYTQKLNATIWPNEAGGTSNGVFATASNYGKTITLWSPAANTADINYWFMGAPDSYNTLGTTYGYLAIGLNADGEPVDPPIPAMTAREAFERSLAAFVQKSASGASVTITDGADNIPVKSLVATITPAQAGSGTPTPSNVRAISGYTEANITVTGDDDSETYTVDWTSEGTKYKGTLDVTTGMLTITHGYATITNVSHTSSPWGTVGSLHLARYIVSGAKSGGSVYSDKFVQGAAATNPYVVQITANNTAVFSTPVADFANQAAWDAWAAANPIQVVFELISPQTYQLTPTEVNTILGNNAISCDTGDISLTYRCDPTILYNAI